MLTSTKTDEHKAQGSPDAQTLSCGIMKVRLGLAVRGTPKITRSTRRHAAPRRGCEIMRAKEQDVN